jgi:hypothetical protein
MKAIRTILFTFLLFAVTTTKAQFIQEIAAGIGTNGLDATIIHPLSQKLFLGESFSVMNWKPSTFGSPFNRYGLAIMHLKFVQTGIFLRWHPFGKETIYGYQKKGLYLTGGVFYKFNDDWLTTSAFYAERKFSDPVSNTIKNQTGEIILNTFTQRLQPFIGGGVDLLKKDSRINLKIEGGISFHGKPDGFVSTVGDLDILIFDILRLEKLHRYLLGFPFFQLHVGYNTRSNYNSAYTTIF